MGGAATLTTVTWKDTGEGRLAAGAIGVLLAIVAGVWHGVLMSAPTNDNFLHLALAQQLLGGDWPVRDFFDHGVGLQFTLSALAELLVGHRLLSEALVVGAAWAVSTFLVFRLVRLLTASTAAAVLSALLLILAGPRGYSYPKVIVYAVAATLWWAYVWNPTARRMAAFGAWTAVAFYWRPDHGVYVAAGVLLAAIAAHGVRVPAVRRSVLAGGVALGLTLPFFLFVQGTVGLREYVETGVAQAEWEHLGSGGHRWPAWPLRSAADVIRLEPADAYAPRITLRWTADSSQDERDAILARYDLTGVASDGPLRQEVRLSERSLAMVRPLINEPIIEDTAGIERSTATLPDSTWTQWERRRFDHRWLRVRLLPGLDEYTRAGEAVAMVFYGLPVIVLLVVPAWRYLRNVTAGSLTSFALFGAVVTIGLLRTPYAVRAVDGVAVPAVLFGVCAAVLGRAAMVGGRARRWLVTAATLVFVLVVLKSVAVAGEFSGHASALTGKWGSVDRMRGAWSEVSARLMASPRARVDDSRATSVPMRLAAYAQECVPAADRLLVLWFAPEIYYYAERLMAQRHLVFVPGWAGLDHEQQRTLMKVRSSAPPLALASSSLDGVTRATYPELVQYVHAEYDLAGSAQDDEREYLILARRDRAVVRTYGEEMWPCYR